MAGDEELVNTIELELQFLTKQLLYEHLLLSIFVDNIWKCYSHCQGKFVGVFYPQFQWIGHFHQDDSCFWCCYNWWSRASCEYIFCACYLSSGALTLSGFDNGIIYASICKLFLNLTCALCFQVEPATLVPLVHGCRQVFLVRNLFFSDDFTHLFYSAVYLLLVNVL